MVNIPMAAKPPMRVAELGSLNRNSPPPGGRPPQPPPRTEPPVQTRRTPPRRHPAPAGGAVLQKGQKTSLSRMNAALDLIEVGVGWDLGPGGQAYELDVEAFLLGPSGRVIGDDWFVFYNQPVSPDGAVRLLGGSAAGDDETVQIALGRLHRDVAKITLIVTINEARERGYSFKNVSNAYVRIVDRSSGAELVRFNLTEYYDTVCSMIVGEVYKHNNEWKFNPVGDGTRDDLTGLCQRYGVQVAG